MTPSNLEQDKKDQKWRDRLMLFCTFCVVIGIPAFALQFGEYRLIKQYEKEATTVQAKVTYLEVQRYRWRTEYTVDITYAAQGTGVVQDSITKVLHANTFDQLSIGDTIDVLVLPQAGEFEEGNVLLQQATTMEYWGKYFWRMIIFGVVSIFGVVTFIYIFITRKQAVERVQRIKEQEGK